MTTFTPLLHAPQIAANQNQKETTINTAMAIFEAACNDQESLSLVSGNRTLSTDEFTKYFYQIYSGQTAPRTVTIPATKRVFAVFNNGAYNVTLHCTGSSGTDLVVVPAKRVMVLSDGTNVVAISQGVSLLSDLSDVSGLGSAANAQLLGYDSGGGDWTVVDAVADKQFFIAGAPSSAQKVFRHVFTRTTLFAADFAGSHGDSDFAATSATHFHVYKNGVLAGTISFAAGAHTATFSTDVGSGSVSLTFSAGDVLLVDASPYVDATLADISVTIKAALR